MQGWGGRRARGCRAKPGSLGQAVSGAKVWSGAELRRAGTQRALRGQRLPTQPGAALGGTHGAEHGRLSHGMARERSGMGEQRQKPAEGHHQPRD